MRAKGAFFIAICFYLTLSSCLKEDNSDKAGYLTLAPYALSDNKPAVYCFDEINGLGLPAFADTICDDTITYLIKLPLNIARDTCTYIFRKGARRDTLKIGYKRAIVDIKNSFQTDFSSLNIMYSTFDSLKVVCTSTQSSTCDEKDFTARIFF